MKALLLAVLLALVGCASGPVVPDWRLNAHSALNAFTTAYLQGNDRLALAEFARARSEISASARVDLLARAELVHCAARVASLELGPCTSYEALARDAGAQERCYARFLAGQWSGMEIEPLPAQYRALVLAAAQPALQESALLAIEDPMSRLIAAGVLLQRRELTPAGINASVQVASDQGWRRALLVWLGVQAQGARAAGDVAELARIQRRLDLAGATSLPP